MISLSDIAWSRIWSFLYQYQPVQYWCWSRHHHISLEGAGTPWPITPVQAIVAVAIDETAKPPSRREGDDDRTPLSHSLDLVIERAETHILPMNKNCIRNE